MLLRFLLWCSVPWFAVIDAGGSSSGASQEQQNPEACEKIFENYKSEKNLTFVDEDDEAAVRLRFCNVFQLVHEHQLKGDKTYEQAINKFTHMQWEDIKSSRTGYRLQADRVPIPNATFEASPDYEAPATVDWRTQGIVTPVEDQGPCASSWAFAAADALASQLSIKNATTLRALSVQQLLDCSTDQGNAGCSDGRMAYAFEYAITAGIVSESDYPYEKKEGSDCRLNKDNILVKPRGFGQVQLNDEEALKQAVAKIGPIAAAVTVRETFARYRSGIYEDKDCGEFSPNHGVLIVGYGTENGKDYWLIKNCWGDDWGEDGYVRMSRNDGNMCKIASAAVYPLLADQ